MADELVRDLPEKLRVTAALLGCANQKDLCAAFRRVNPKSDFDLERSYKWMQGRAAPRSARVYEDWAALVGAGDRPPSWLASCTLEDFVGALCARHGAERDALLRRAGLNGHGDGGRRVEDAAPRAAGGPDGYLCGAYACYSHAQSPYYRGRLVRGALAIAPAARRTADGLVATYSQALATGRAHASGPVGLYGRALCLELRSPSPGMAPMFCSLFRPSPPASVLAGIMCGTTAMDPAWQPPYATRILMVRVPGMAAAADLENSNRYLDAADASPARDLAALGLEFPDPAALDAAMGRFLGPGGGGPPWSGSDQASGPDYAEVAMTCDRAWLDRAAGAAARAGAQVPPRPGGTDPAPGGGATTAGPEGP